MVERAAANRFLANAVEVDNGNLYLSLSLAVLKRTATKRSLGEIGDEYSLPIQVGTDSFEARFLVKGDAIVSSACGKTVEDGWHKSPED